MALTVISGEIAAQPLNDNFSEGKANLDVHLAEFAQFEVETVAGINSISLRAIQKPTLIEQFVTSFYSRGQLASEKTTEGIVTEQFIGAAASVGDNSITVTDGTKFTVGGGAVIKYDDGTYQTYFIRTIASNTLGISPSLKKALTTSSKIERTWYNSAHPGKFYMRFLAQRLVDETYINNSQGENVFYANFDGTTDDDVGTAVNGASIGYNDAVNVVTGPLYGSVLECAVGKVAYFDTSLANAGIKLPSFNVNSGERLILRIFAMSRNADTTTKIAIKNQGGTVIAELDVSGSDSQIMQPYEIEFSTRYDVTSAYVEVTNQTAVANVFFIDEVRVLRNYDIANPLYDGLTIVGFGDSWVAGDTVSTPERESFLTHLAVLLPRADIINEGFGGDKVQDLLARFDTDVIPHNPDIVIVNVGTNDSYNPASGTFDPNSIDYFVGRLKELSQRIISIGAKPVIIGVPALAEEDGIATNFLLNDRARSYNKRLYRNINKDNSLNEEYSIDVGITNAYAVTLKPAATKYVEGMTVKFKASSTNTAGATLDVNGLGVKTIRKSYNVPIVSSEIKANQIVEVIYDGTDFQLLSPLATALSSSSATIRSWSTVTDGDTTPSVANKNGVIISNTSPTSITEFDDSVTNQEIHIVFGTGNTTLVNSATLKLAGNINWTPTANSSIVLYKATVLTSAWLEKCRMQY